MFTLQLSQQNSHLTVVLLYVEGVCSYGQTPSKFQHIAVLLPRKTSKEEMHAVRCYLLQTVEFILVFINVVEI